MLQRIFLHYWCCPVAAGIITASNSFSCTDFPNASVSVYKCLSVQVSQCTSVSVYKCLSVQVSHCTSVSVYKCLSGRLSYVLVTTVVHVCVRYDSLQPLISEVRISCKTVISWNINKKSGVLLKQGRQLMKD